MPPDVPVSINTLENVLFMDVYNDISFEIGGKLVVLIEHQSTINPNMALRMFLYISRVLEKTLDAKNLYSDRLLSIPRPEFYVLYNGKENYPDQKVLKLSELFENPDDIWVHENMPPLLELEVKVININEGRNRDLLKRCKRLSEYSTFMAKAKMLTDELDDKTRGVEEAVKYCYKRGILKDFLKKHGSEVLSMLLTEWNTEDAKKVWYEDGREDGREDEKIIIARNLLLEGSSLEFIQKITGLDMKTIQELSNFPNSV